MANTNFVDSQTPVVAAWLNDVNDLTYSKQFPDGTYAYTTSLPDTITANDVEYTPSGTNAEDTTVQAKLREVVSILDFIPAGTVTATTDCTTYFQNAIDSTTGGITIYIPQGTYKITDTVYLKRNGVHLVGAGFENTVINFVNAAGGTAFAGDSGKSASTNTYSYCSLENFSIGSVNASTDATVCVELTSFSYSRFDLVVQTKRASAFCYRGFGNNGSSPYYNVISGSIFGGSDQTQYGIYFGVGSWAGGSPGPNANIIGPIQRAASLQYLAYIKAGNGNLFSNINGESISNCYFYLGGNAAIDSGTSSGSNSDVVFKDSTKSWTTNAYVNAGLLITGGTGSGQSRLIGSNTATQLVLVEPWATIPDSTSTYAIYPSYIFGNKIVNVRTEGSADSDPDFIYAEPGVVDSNFLNCSVASLGNGLWVRDQSGATSNDWFGAKKMIVTEVVENPGAALNKNIYPRSSALGGVHVAGDYVVEWVKVASNTATLSDTAVVTLDAGGTTVGGGTTSIVANLTTGNTQAMAMPASDKKTPHDGSNAGIFLNLTTGASFSATADLIITWCISLI